MVNAHPVIFISVVAKASPRQPRILDISAKVLQRSRTIYQRSHQHPWSPKGICKTTIYHSYQRWDVLWLEDHEAQHTVVVAKGNKIAKKDTTKMMHTRVSVSIFLLFRNMKSEIKSVIPLVERYNSDLVEARKKTKRNKPYHL